MEKIEHFIRRFSDSHTMECYAENAIRYALLRDNENVERSLERLKGAINVYTEITGNVDECYFYESFYDLRDFIYEIM